MIVSSDRTVTKANILIVDERAEQLKQVALVLSEWGYLAHAANSFSTLLMQINAIEPRLILININLSEIESIEIYYILKSSPQTSQIPIIFFNDLNNLHAQLELVSKFSLTNSVATQNSKLFC